MTIDRAARHVSGPQVLLAMVAALICAAASIPALMPHPVIDAAEAVATGAAAPSHGTPAAVGSTPSTRPIAGPMDRTDLAPDPDLVLLGSSRIAYAVGPENGHGANIEIPLHRLDRLVIAPNATFDFWRAIGEVSWRTGYRRGGILVGGRIDPTGALAGGICTVSTALFDAAARAGLEIVSRTSHRGYLAKYPLGLDAAVAKGDGSRQTMAFRNDTSEPILIRTVSTSGIARVDLFAAAAAGRQVTFSPPTISHWQRHTHVRHVRSASVRRGQQRRVEPASDGMTVIVTRTVRDASGRIIHQDRWVSVYRPLDGLVLDGTG